ncbi:AraC family transcriptional regulator, partial [Shigella dysenteriae]|uniref:AraC family transcriptional regulator n=1 Tax=Shigella dysenteriae TaxID=622 RepID=UPI000E5CF0C4
TLKSPSYTKSVSWQHYPIHEVAQRCGFPDSDYFCRVFRRQFGLTPGEYSARFQG